MGNSMSLVEFPALRSRRHDLYISLQAVTGPCVLAGLAGGAAYFGSMELDATKPIMVGASAPLRVPCY